jgi:hypothetical protein
MLMVDLDFTLLKMNIQIKMEKIFYQMVWGREEGVRRRE